MPKKKVTELPFAQWETEKGRKPGYGISGFAMHKSILAMATLLAKMKGCSRSRLLRDLIVKAFQEMRYMPHRS
jgi:hypothetical protein